MLINFNSDNYAILLLIYSKGVVVLNKNTVLDKGYFISSILNIFFLLGLIFISRLENLYILIPYAILMGINAVYLVVKTAKINNNKFDI